MTAVKLYLVYILIIILFLFLDDINLYVFKKKMKSLLVK